MDSAPTPSGPTSDISTWTIEQVQNLAAQPGQHGQELERIRCISVAHAQRDRLDPDSRKKWAKLSLQVNARMHGDGPWEQMRMLTQNFRLRTLIIDRLGPDPQDPDWDPELVAAEIFAALTLTPDQARERSDHWQTRPLDQINELRRIKNTTAPLQQLLRHLQPGPPHDQAREWLAIRELLP
jgi:hypothetical protein